MMLIILFILMFIIIFGTMIRASLIGAPWVPTFGKTVLEQIKLAGIKPGEIVYDLGCGDGRWLFTAARLTPGKKFIGYEISVLPYLLAKVRQLFSSDRSRLEFRFKNYFQEDLSRADVVYCFGLPEVIGRLEPKLAAELKAGARLVSYVFRLPHKQPAEVFRFKARSQASYLYRY
ncbi:MAG: class I SAM-dependent methyltransferase [Candidatus Komeilibacteria bacterium]|nr:class I SAM-dependent methyltransferase [Candidatus Komeilibacteria bacterium]